MNKFFDRSKSQQTTSAKSAGDTRRSASGERRSFTSFIHNLHGRRPGRRAAFAASLLLALALTFGVFYTAFADDANNKTHNQTYTDNIKNNFGDAGSATGVHQSTDPTSRTKFGAALPLSTIYIDQSKIWELDTSGNLTQNAKSGYTYELLATDPTFASGIKKNGALIYYDPSGSDELKKLKAGELTKLEGKLFSFTFPGAAILDDGTTADVVFTFSNAEMAIDQRFLYTGGEEYQGKNYPTTLSGKFNLANGAAPSWGTDDNTFETIRRKREADFNSLNAHVTEVASRYKDQYPDLNPNFTLTNTFVGGNIDINIKVIKSDTKDPVPGTFVFATTGINLDRSPRAISGINIAKPGWYMTSTEEKITVDGVTYNVYKKNGTKYIKKSDNLYYEVTDGTVATSPADPQPQDPTQSYVDNENYFFSEAMEINGGLYADGIYTRPQTVNSGIDPDNKNRSGYCPDITTQDNHVKFISHTESGISGSDGSFTAGFVTVADSANGVTVTSTGHGATSLGMNSPFFNAEQIWYRYTSSSGPHGKIQTTQEGNYNGDLALLGTKQDKVLGQGTYVVMEGKDITYKMTPDTGYKLAKLEINGVEVKYDRAAVSKMKKGDSMTVTTAAGRTGTLTYTAGGYYTFKFPDSKHDEVIHVEWEPTTADVLAYKIWDDKDDADGMRVGADGTENWPKMKLQQSLDGGASWTDVDYTNNTYNKNQGAENIPNGKNSSDKYKDGTYEKNKGNAVHPFTWEYLPVYTYDSNGTADRVILYRLVEGEAPGTEPVLTGYKSPQYADGQSFYLTSDESKTIDGWVIYKDSSDGKEYILKDGKYYEVNDWVADTEPAESQPTPSDLSPISSSEKKVIDGKQVLKDRTNNREYVLVDEKYYEVLNNKISEIAVADKDKPDPDDLVDAVLNGYNTADKAIPYQSVSVKNEHKVSDIYVDVTKTWNDGYLYQQETSPEGGNDYDRRNITFTLHGTVKDGDHDKVVDLDPDSDSDDLTLTIEKSEDQTKRQATGDKKIDGYTIYENSNHVQYALVKNHATYSDGYYMVSDDQINYAGGSVVGPTDLKVVKNGDGTYKIDNFRYGAMFENLQAYHDGQLIQYTITESFGDIGAWNVTGGTLTPVKDGSGKLTGYTLSDPTAVKENQELLGYEAGFVNTPIIKDKYDPLPVTIVKRDAYTGALLKGATFTVYTDPFNKVKPETSTYKQVDGLTAVTDGTREYVKKADGKYYEVTGTTIAPDPAVPQPSGTLEKVKNTNYKKIDGKEVWTDNKGHNYVLQSDGYHAVDAEGSVAGEPADQQPDPDALSGIEVPGAVDEITVTTDANGKATVNFNQTGEFYLVETGAPEGYEDNSGVSYKFVVDKQLRTVTLAGEATGDSTQWWERLHDLLFGNGTTADSGFVPADNKMSGTLTVKDTPLTGHVLVRKIWDDANDQDGARPSKAEELPYVKLQYTTDDVTDPDVTPTWQTAQVYDSAAASPGMVDVQPRQVTYAGGAIHASSTNAYTWIDLPAYRDGKIVYYRVDENDATPDGHILTDGIYKITSNKTASTGETVFNLIDDEGKETNQIVNVTNTHKPQLLTVHATKHWNDNHNQESLRPSKLQISLWKVVNNEESKLYDLTLDGTADTSPSTNPYEVEPTDDDTWNAVFKDLPAYEAGSPVIYKLVETLDDKDKISYIGNYSIDYTKTDGSSGAKSNEDSILANDVKRTFEKETKEVGGVTYTVYEAGGKKYIRTGDDQTEYIYYEIKSDGTVDMTTQAEPQPTDPAVSYTDTETTDATIRVDNVLKNNVNTTKYWIGGANANVRFTLYRTTETGKALDWEDEPSHADPVATTESVTEGSDTYTICVHANGKKYVDKSTTDQHEWHEVTGAGTSADPYVIAADQTTPTIRTWTPFDTDGTTLINGWEKVNEHLFVSSAFSTSLTLPGDDESHLFEDLPTMAPDGKPYTYRILETTTAGATEDERFEGHYDESGVKVTNINRKMEDSVVDIDVLKDLQGREWDARYKETKDPNDKDAFYFWIEPVKDVDDEGEITEFDPDDQDKTRVPLPGDRNTITTQYGRAVEQNTAVGTTSRKVSFSSILYRLSDLGSESSPKTYYYKVYEAKNTTGTAVEEKDDKGITYDGTGTGDTWQPKTVVMKVELSPDGSGGVTATPAWGEVDSEGTFSWGTTTPVFRNKYSSEGVAKAWIEKDVATRAWKDYANGKGDAYQFTVTGIAGAELNTPGHEGDSYTTMPLVTSSTEHNPQEDLQQLSDSMWAFGITGNTYTGDMLGSNGEAYYIYGITENDSATSTKDQLGLDGYKVDNVSYDKSKIYAKVHVKDNWDGTLTFDIHYYTDASCKSKYEIKDHMVWIIDKTEGSIQTKRLLDEDERAEAERMTPEQCEAEGYRKVNVAHFTNYEVVDIPVTKQWIDGPPVEDVTVHLERHLFELTAEENLDDEDGVGFIETEEKHWTGPDDFWERIGFVKDFPRGDFLTQYGMTNYDVGSETTSSRTYNIPGFNQDLPRYVVKDGTTYRAVYKLVENDTSDAYETTYGPQYYINDSSFDPEHPDRGLVVKNTVKATNEANIAAVKQLLGRGWTEDDDFPFILTPVGKGTYDKDGNFDRVQETADIPMPEGSAEGYAEAHAKSGTTTVDPNGNLERLARFGAITYDINDLVYNGTDKHYQGDFFYIMKEAIPDDAKNADGKTYGEATDEEKAAGGFAKDGITYDSDEHTVHVRVRENRTHALMVQIGYDETKQGEVSTGTQFTPVYTNRYDAEVVVTVGVDKYIMGRDWKSTDKFDFRMTAMGGAPFEDADKSEFPTQDTHSDDERNADLEEGCAIHSARGAHVKRMKDVDISKEVQHLDMPKLKFKLSELNKTVETADSLTYSDGTPVPVGTSYGEFVYSVEEINDYLKDDAVADLIKDPDTEYIRITVIDHGDGKLVYYTDIFEDRYCETPRYAQVEDPDSAHMSEYYEYNEKKKTFSKTTDTDPVEGKIYYMPATSLTFVNQLSREISATKAWAGHATEDVTFKLQWSVDKEHWYDAGQTAWLADALAGKGGQRTISKNATGDELTLSCDDLPAYANILRNDDMTGESGDDLALNDLWVYYRIAEITPEGADVRYNETPYLHGDKMTNIKYQKAERGGSPFHTEDERDGDGHYIEDKDRVTQFYVTNFPKDVSGTANVGVVKQYIGKAWEDETFTFEMTPVKSKLGGEERYYADGEEKPSGVYENKDDPDDKIDKKTYNALTPEEQSHYKELKETNKMPSLGQNDTAEASKETSEVSVNEHSADFAGLTIKRSDLDMDDDGKVKGTFIYRIKEVPPTGAVPTGEICDTLYVNKTNALDVITEAHYDSLSDEDKEKYKLEDLYYYVAADGKGNQIKYTTAVHFVKVVATDDGGSDIDIVVSFDNRKSGEFVPVYTNYALMQTPIEGTKTWVGGKKKEHRNGEVELNDDNTAVTGSRDDLEIQLYRKLKDSDQEPVLMEKDNAGRDLVIVWAKANREKIKYIPTEDTSVVGGKKYYAYDSVNERYVQVTPAEGDNPQENEWYEKTTSYKITWEKQEGEAADASGSGKSGPYTYTVMAKDEDNKYVDPYLDAADSDGNQYEYYVEEPDGVPNNYDHKIEGLDVTNSFQSVDKPVRITWVSDSDMDKTTGKKDYKLTEDTSVVGGKKYYAYDSVNDRYVQVTPAEGDNPQDKGWFEDGRKDKVSKDRPSEVTVTLQAELPTGRYTYNGEVFETKKAAVEAAIEAGGSAEDVKPEKKWRDVTDPEDDTKSWSVTLDKRNAEEGDPDNWFDNTFKELPKYDANGEEITYRVVQTGIKYADGSVISGEKKDGLTASVSPRGYKTGTFDLDYANSLTTILNTYETTVITGTKTWDDAESGIRHNNSSEVKLIVERTDKAEPGEDDWTTLKAGEDYHVDWSDKGEGADRKDKQFTVRGLARWADADAATPVPYRYQITEEEVSGYKPTYKEAGSKVAALTQSGGEIINTPAKITVEALKVWKGDEEVKDQRKPVTFQLYREIDGARKKLTGADLPKDSEGEAQMAAQTLTPDQETHETPSATWENLPTQSGDKDVSYTVKEVEAPEGYSIAKTEYARTTGEGSEAKDEWSEEKPEDWNGKIRITNSYDADKVSIPVRKVWKDKKDQDGVRPDGVTVKVQAQTEENTYSDVYIKDGVFVTDPEGATHVDDLVLNKDNNWKKLFKDLPKTDAKGKAVTYRVVEMDGTTVLDGSDGHNKLPGKTPGSEYTVQITGSQTDGYVITNTYDPDTLKVTVIKEWQGDDNVEDDTRKNVTLHLIGRTEADDKAAVAFDGGEKTIEIGVSDTVTWGEGDDDKLPAKIDGKELTWEVYEDTIPGYVMSGGDDPVATYAPVTAQTGDNPKARVWYERVGENSYEPTEDTTVVQGKTYYEFTGYEFTVTNKYVGAVNQVKAVKVWEDDDNRDGLRADVRFQLYRKVGADGEEEPVGDPMPLDDKDSVTWTDLPEVLTGTTSDVTKQAEYTQVDTTGMDPETTSPQEKGWYVEDTENPSGYSPATAEQIDQGVQYYTMTPEEVEEHETERAVVYWVKEVDVPDGYRSSVVQTEPGKFEVTNIHVPETTKVQVMKIWSDSDDAEGVRPDHITFRLKSQVGEGKVKTVKDHTVVSGQAGWGSYYTFDNLPKYEDGKVIYYTVVELDPTSGDATELDGTTGHNTMQDPAYVASLAYGSGPDGGEEWTDKKPENWNGKVIITNSFAQADAVNLTAYKKWEGDEGDTQDRGDVTFKLIRVRTSDGATKDMSKEDPEYEVTLPYDPDNPDAVMKYTWKGLPSTVKNVPVTYTVEEDPVPELYTKHVSDVEYAVVTPQDGDNPKENGWYEEKDGKYILTADETVQEGKDYYEYRVIVTNSRGEIPLKGSVMYIDPLNKAGEEGSGQMILKSTKYRTAEEAQSAAESKSDKPADPKHKGKVFTGWALNWDKDGDTYVLVATYSDEPPAAKPITTYIDPQSGKPLLVSGANIKKPANPKHDGMVFVKWVKVKDAAGNTIYVAKFKCAAKGSSASAPPRTLSARERNLQRVTVVDTGDAAQLPLMVLFLTVSGAFAAAVVIRRRREDSRRDDAA